MPCFRRFPSTSSQCVITAHPRRCARRNVHGPTARHGALRPERSRASASRSRRTASSAASPPSPAPTPRHRGGDHAPPPAAPPGRRAVERVDSLQPLDTLRASSMSTKARGERCGVLCRLRAFARRLTPGRAGAAGRATPQRGVERAPLAHAEQCLVELAQERRPVTVLERLDERPPSGIRHGRAAGSPQRARSARRGAPSRARARSRAAGGPQRPRLAEERPNAARS